MELILNYYQLAYILAENDTLLQLKMTQSNHR